MALHLTIRVLGQYAPVGFYRVTDAVHVLRLDAEFIFLSRFKILDDVRRAVDNAWNFVPEITAFLALLHDVTWLKYDTNGTPKWNGTRGNTAERCNAKTV